MEVVSLQFTTSSFSRIGSAILERKGRAGKGVGLALDIVLVILLASVLARLVWVMLAPTAFVTDVPQISTSTVTAEQTRLQADPAFLARFNPFNRDLSASEVTIEEDAPETSLNLEIRSLIASTDPDKSLVRLRLPDNSDQRFRVGDTIVSGVTLERILSDRVILSRSGRREVLYTNESRVVEAFGETSQPRQQAITPNDVGAGSDGPADRVDLTDASVADFETFYNGVQLRRIAEEDGATVLVIHETSDAALLTRLGLAAGDRLRTLNGYDLSQDSLSDLYEDLKGARQLDLVITRDGRERSQSIMIGTDIRENDDE